MSQSKMFSLFAAILSIIVYAFFHTQTIPPLSSGQTATTVLPTSHNTSLTLFTEPEAGISPLLTLIQSASSSIDLVMYQLEDMNIETALVKKVNEGIPVRVLLNKGYYGRQENDRNNEAFTYLTDNGVAVHWTPSYFALTHQKTLIIDHSKAFIMTFNLTPRYYASGRDFAIIDSNTTDVDAIQSAFNDDWGGNKKTASNGIDLVWSPGSKDELLSLINNAHTSLDIYNEEMADTDIITALSTAAKRGVSVRIVMTYSTNWKKAFQTLSENGVSIHTFAKSAPLYIHAKMIVADKQRAFVGSENFSSNSMSKNRELGIVTNESALLTSLETTFAQDWDDARPFVAQ